MKRSLDAKSRRWPVIGMSACLLLIASSAWAGDWMQFRGVGGQGVSDASGVPTSWSPSENIKWKAELPGPGFSCPIVVGDRVFLTCYTGYAVDRENPGDIESLKRHLVCVDRGDGSIAWTKSVDSVQPEDPFTPPGTTAHGYASQTPVSDGERVYVFFGKTGVLAYDMDGEQLWQTSVGTESGPRRWGSAASPILFKNLVIVNASAESRSIVALDKLSGEEVWRAEAEGMASTWTTPVLAAKGDAVELVVPTPAEIWSLNPHTGKLNWYAVPYEASGIATSLVVGDGIVYCVGGMRGGGSAAVRIGGKGDVTDSHVAWTGKGNAQFATPVMHDGYLYGANAEGIAFCVDAETGEATYRARLATGEAVEQSDEPSGMQRGGGGMQRGGGGMQPRGEGGAQRGGGPTQGGRRGGGGGMADRSYGSPILIDGKVYLTNHSGETFILAADPEKLTILAKNQLATDDNHFNATPAAVDGQLLIRSSKYLYCISEE